jgi:uncharacterized protein (TIGR03067 family)
VKKWQPPLAALLVFPLLASDAPRGHDDATLQADGIEGTWVRVAAEMNGRKADIIPGTLTFRDGGRLLEETNGAPTRPGEFNLEAGRTPSRLDIVYAGDPPGLTRRFICQVEADTLRVGFTLDHTAARPEAFGDKGTAIVTYKRAK